MKIKRRLLAIVMTVLMMLTMLPSMVFAEAVPSGTLDGRLKVKGPVAVDTTLSADYSKAKPEGLTDDYVTFKWSRKNGEELLELGTEKTYKVTAEDLGYPIVLEVTGIEEKGVSGKLTVTTYAAVATAEEAAPFEAEQQARDAAEEAEQPEAEEVEVIEEYPQDMPEEPPVEVINETVEEFPQAEEESPSEEIPEASEENWEDTGIPEATEETWGTTEDGDVYVINEEIPAEQPAAEEQPAGEGTEETAEPVYEAEAYTEDGTGILDFGTLEFGYTEVGEAQYVTVKNTGNTALNFEGIAPEHFMVQDIENTLNPEESVSLWIQPRENMEPGTYEDTITYTSVEGAQASFQAKVVVMGVELEEAEEPSEESDPDMEVFDESSNSVSEESGEQTTTDEPIVIPEETPAAEPTVVPEETPAAEPTVVPEETPAAEPTEAPEETPAAEPTEAPAEYMVAVTPETLDFGSDTVGYDALQAQTVTITNNGSSKITLMQPVSTSYDVSELSAVEVEAGASVQFTVQPKSGLGVGTYAEDIYLYPLTEEADAQAVARVSVNFIVKEALQPKLTVNPESYDFGRKEEGYTELPGALTVTVTNSGNTVINLEQPVNPYFMVGALSAAVLNPGESSSFNVVPVEGLAEGQYVEEIVIPNRENAAASVKVSFLVSKTAVKLTGIQAPGEITGISNGAEKSAAALKLPENVVITTTNGEMKANVTWDVKGCSYDASSLDAQSFNVKGSVTLPSGIENPDGIALLTSVKVTVDGRPAKTADPAANQITGIAADGKYTTETKISFTAVGAGMDNAAPRTGDTRYIPLKWNVLEDRTWDKAPYAATFRMGQGGNYALKVTFNEQKYDGSNWVNTGTQDTKQVNFTVSAAQTLTGTPTPTLDPSKKNAVATGDNSVIMPFVIILILAVLCIAGIVVYRKKKK